MVGRLPESPSGPGDTTAASTASGATTSGDFTTQPAPTTGLTLPIDTDPEARAKTARHPLSSLKRRRLLPGGPLNVGQSFGRYHILGLLGAGGMGAVYLAWDTEMTEVVAVKVILPDASGSSGAAEIERRFKNELRLARQVTHKNVVRIHDLGDIDGIKYITMSFIEGDDLATILKREGALGVTRSLRLARQIAAGLQAAHEAAVVHRDLKPANIMISPDEEALIMDFGIARSNADRDRPAGGGIVGTLQYMAPEQAKGKPVDGRADIYALGLILFEMLTGPRKQDSGAVHSLGEVRARIESGLPSVRSIDDTIPETVAGITSKCLEIDPANRYQSSADLEADLTRLDDAGEVIPEPRRLTRRLVAATLGLVAVLVGGTYFVGRQTAPAPPKQLDPVSVLVSDFDNRSGEPLLDGSVEQALGLALEGAPYITLFKAGSARSIAASLAPDRSNRITQEIGQLIARREGIKVLLAGAIEAEGRGFRLDMKVIDPATGQPTATVARSVRDKNEVLSTVQAMAITVRESLGEAKTEMAKLAAAETVTAGSLEAMAAYARANELAMSNKIPEALTEYQRVLEFDPRMGRAYAGMAVLYANTKQADKAEANYQAAMKNLDRMSEREKYRTLGTYYMNVAQNQEKAIENYETLVRLYPADDAGHGNLALAYVKSGNVPRAVAEVKKALEIYPKNALQRYNYAMYSMYAGDFDTAIAEATKLQTDDPKFEYFYLPLAISNLARGDAAAARDTWTRLSDVSALGASFATLGQADAEMYFGQNQRAIRRLRDGLAADAKNKNPSEQARKAVALAETYLALGQRARAVQLATEATTLSRSTSTLVPAAFVFVGARQVDKARRVADDLEKLLQRETTSYARLIGALIAIENNRLADAIETFRDAQKRYDSWFGRFLLGKAYVQAEHYTEGLAELELAVKRAGETTDVFIDDMATLRYLPPAYYWLARASEGAGAATQARQHYERFLSLRAEADPGDPLVADARKRLTR